MTSPIVKILDVVDTREYVEEPDGRFRAIAGSGIEHECARCGRVHEVHATVALADGSSVVVGTTCMKEETLAKEMVRRASTATRIRRLGFELAAARKTQAELSAIEARVDALPIPEIEIVSGDAKVDELGCSIDCRLTVRCGDGFAWVFQSELTPERKAERIDCARSDWRDKRFAEFGASMFQRNMVAFRIRRLEKEIAKIETTKAADAAGKGR